MTVLRAAVVAVLIAAAAGCASHRATPGVPPATGRVLETHSGVATFYGKRFNGRRTASGMRFNMRAMVAAHPSYPFGTKVLVTNLANDRAVIVTIVDRGPAPSARRRGVIIDLSRGAAERLAMIRAGRQRVRVDVLAWGQP